MRRPRNGPVHTIWIPVAAVGAAIVLALDGLVVGALASTTFSKRIPSQLVYTTWVPDERVTGGAEVGFRPALSGLGGRDVVSAHVSRESSGPYWQVTIFFTPNGARLLSRLTSASVAACPGNPRTERSATCVGRHLGMWIDLTQADIDRWRDPAYSSIVSLPWDPGLTGDPRRKLLVNPITLVPSPGGVTVLHGEYSQARAQEIATAVNPVSVTGVAFAATAIDMLVAAAVLIPAGGFGLVSAWLLSHSRRLQSN